MNSTELIIYYYFYYYHLYVHFYGTGAIIHFPCNKIFAAIF